MCLAPSLCTDGLGCGILLLVGGSYTSSLSFTAVIFWTFQQLFSYSRCNLKLLLVFSLAHSQCIYEINCCKVSLKVYVTSNRKILNHEYDCCWSDSQSLVTECVLPLVLYTSKSSIRTFGEARTKKIFRPVRFGLPGTLCLTGQQLKGMICSSMQTFSVFRRLRQPCRTWSSNGLTFHWMSVFFIYSVIARSSTILSEFIGSKNPSHVILHFDA